MMTKNLIYTGSKFINKKIYIESFGDKELDAALKSVFHDYYHRTAPLRVAREDCQLLFNSEKVDQSYQMPLFKGKDCKDGKLDGC